MKPIEYCIIRYRHDIVTEEFVNVGLILFDIETKTLTCKIIEKYKRISDFFYGAKGNLVIRSLKNIKTHIRNLNEKLSTEFDFNSLVTLSSIISKTFYLDDGSIQFSSIYKGITLDYNLTLDELFEKLIVKYDPNPLKKSRTDEDARKIIYRDYFANYGISNKLISNEIKTKNDLFEFEGWKNDRWHYYKPISFDLLEKETIKEKVYKWSGITSELKTSEDPFNLFFLALDPKLVKDDELINFINNKLEDSNNNYRIKIIHENELDSFTKHESEEIKKH